MSTAIGNLIKERRTSQNLRQEDLAEMVGQSQPEVSNVERGRAHPRNLDLYIKALGIERGEVMRALLELAFDNDQVVQAINRAKALDRDARQALVTIYKHLVISSSGLLR